MRRNCWRSVGKTGREMPSYFDSSFLLSGLLRQPGSEGLAPYWNEEGERLSSYLLEAECVIVLRRAAEERKIRERPAFLRGRMDLLDEYLSSMILKPIDDEVLALLRQDVRLAGCRTLDAIHLATALLYQAHSDEPMVLLTLDARMKALARAVGLRVAP